MEDERIVLRSYSNLKNIKIKIYKIGNLPTLIPIEIEMLSILAASLFLVLIVNAIVEIPLNPIYKFIGIPIGIAMILKTAKIDGKKPHMYILRLLQYQRIRKKTIERFNIKDDIEEINFSK